MHASFFAAISVPPQYDGLKGRVVKKTELIIQTVFTHESGHAGTQPLPIFVNVAVFMASNTQDWIDVQIACRDIRLIGHERQLIQKAQRMLDLAVPDTTIVVSFSAELEGRMVNPLEGYTVGPLLEGQVEDALRFDNDTAMSG